LSKYNNLFYQVQVDTRTAPKQQSEESRVINNKVLKGLPNFGNSCYINAALQCIASIDEIKSQKQNEPLHNFLDNYHQSKTAALTKDQMGFITQPYFDYIGQQDDSADILGRIIDNLSNEKFSKVNTQKTYKCENNNDVKTGRTPSIENIFSVAMYTNKKNIQEIINESYTPVNLPEGSNMLELCGNDRSITGKATTETSIAYFEGNYAIIQLKRFYTEFINGAYIHRKINDPITVEKTITLKTNNADQPADAEFEFHSMINHIGDRLNSGHYTANVLSINTLYNCNDSIITKEKEILDNNIIVENSIQVYVVIYKKKLLT
jgi:ubiquitin C-terminal hydrolase